MKGLSVVLLGCTLSGIGHTELVELTPESMADVSGQMGLLDIQRFNNAGNNFYRLAANATVQTSINLDRLLLTDGNGDAQIDIENFSLNGGDDSNGNAAVSSATITNPFIEFAFAGDLSNDDISTREFIGIRLGADAIDGFLSFGERSPDGSVNTGINRLRGYLTTNPLSGQATTQAVTNQTGGSVGQAPYQVNALVSVLGIQATTTFPDAALTFPAVTANFTTPSIVINGTLVNGNPNPSAQPNGSVTGLELTVPNIPLPDLDFSLVGDTDVTIDFGFLGELTIPFGEFESSGTLQGLTAESLFTEDLRFIHRVPVSNNGFYLSFQNRAIKWQGSPGGTTNVPSANNDIAQPGWWLSVENPVDLGSVAVSNVQIPDVTIRTILSETSAFLTNTSNDGVPITVGLGGIFGGSIDVGTLNLAGIAAPIPFPLSNEDLGSNQNHIVNCWNGQLGC